MKLLLAKWFESHNSKKISKVVLKLHRQKKVPKETNIGVRKRVTCKKIEKYHQQKRKKERKILYNSPICLFFIKEILIFIK